MRCIINECSIGERSLELTQDPPEESFQWPTRSPPRPADFCCNEVADVRAVHQGAALRRPLEGHLRRRPGPGAGHRDQSTPFNKLLDQNEPYMSATTARWSCPTPPPDVREFLAAGLIAGPFGEELDGGNLPSTVHQAAMTWFQAANPAMSSYTFLTVGNANLLAEYGTPEQIDTWCARCSKAAASARCLSEPGAGSSLSDITTKATPVGDGTYRVSGTRCDPGRRSRTRRETSCIWHWQGAGRRTGRVKGIRCSSCQKVPGKTAPATTSLWGLNHKMGQRGTNTLPQLWWTAPSPSATNQGAVGYLVGEEHKGLFAMFHMMNEARIGVGLATAIVYAGCTRSRWVRQDPHFGAVPSTRRSCVQASGDHPDIRRQADAAGAEVVREGGLALGLLVVDPGRPRRDRHR